MKDVESRNVLKYNDTCPICGVVIQPILQSYHNSNVDYIYAILECTKCHNFYFEVLVLDAFSDETSQTQYISSEVFPSPLVKLDIPQKMKTYYPEFYKIYAESAKAESIKLNEICGMGYRKALEYLIKHYAIDCYPEDKAAIENELLVPTIRRLKSDRLTTLATAATWLGNDQTHLIKKHPNCDLEELKSFMVALCQFILSEKEFEKAQALINSAKKPS